jgi:hypothetical protein
MTGTVAIGKGLCRIKIKSQNMRDRLAELPNVMVDNQRVIFPAAQVKEINAVLRTTKRG